MNKVTTWKLWLHVGGYFLCFVVAGGIAVLPRILIGAESEEGYIVFISEILRIILTIASLVFYTKYIVKLPEMSVEILDYKNSAPARWILLGLSLPLLLIGILLGLELLIIDSIDLSLSYAAIINSLLFTAGIALASGILEELVFRGYMLKLLQQKYSFWIAGLIPSIIFSMIHLGGAGSLQNSIQILLGGILVSILFLSIYKVTRKIWNACIVHVLWNFILLNQLIYISDSVGTTDKVLVFLQKGNTLLTGVYIWNRGFNNCDDNLCKWGSCYFNAWQIIIKDYYEVRLMKIYYAAILSNTCP